MYMLHQLAPGETTYNVPIVLRLRGPLQVGRLRDALAALVRRHASLRTAFGLNGESIVQILYDDLPLPLPIRVAKDDAELTAPRGTFVRPFDLHRPPLARAYLVRQQSPMERNSPRLEQKSLLLLDLHHIICDGVSVDLLIEDLGRLYGGDTLPPLKADCTDFARWQAEVATTNTARRQEAHWLRLLGGERPVADLPLDHPRPRTPSYRGSRVLAHPPRRLVEDLRALAARHRVSLYMLLLAAYTVLLAKYTGQNDLTVGTLVSGRPDARFDGVVGLFVNTLVLRAHPTPDLEIPAYLAQVRALCLDAFENQDYQFEDLVERLAPPRDLGRTPLFDALFAALTAPPTAVTHGGVSFERHDPAFEISKFDLSLTALDQENGDLVLEFEYRLDLFRAETIERLSTGYLSLLRALVGPPPLRLSDLQLADPVPTPAPTPTPIPAPSVIDLFHAQVRQTPTAPALTYGALTLTYAELNRRSGALAVRLRHRGVDRGALVGLVSAPSVEAVIAILAILRLGAAYLPLDPTTPRDRIRSIVATSGASMVLLTRETQGPADDGTATLLLDDEVLDDGAIAETPDGNREADATDIRGEDLAYVIYTSGSTGTPKGVMISHRALAHYITWAVGQYVDVSPLSFALHTPLSVDLTVTSIFLPLVSGNRIVLYRTEDALERFRDILRDNQVEIVKLTPTHLALLAEATRDIAPSSSRLRTLILGGEDLKTSLSARITAAFPAGLRIFNEYGPTEATVGCMIHRYDPEIDTGPSVSIGVAIADTGLHVLDDRGRPVPMGVVGELCIAGAGLADGYLNAPDLTAERFVWRRIGSQDVRLYRSGDLARITPSGRLDYLGRADDQVKLRGFRIELGEIEATLLRHPDITEAVVMPRQDAAGDPYLCGYVVGRTALSEAALRRELAADLPEYMIPTRIVQLDRLPIARGGKVDKAALPAPAEPAAGARPYAIPTTAPQRTIATIWAQVLGRPEVGLDDDFFDLGGQSLKATLMIARINRALSAHLALRDAFTHRTVRTLAALVAPTEGARTTNKGADLGTVIAPVARRDHYPVSAAQKRLFIVHRLAPNDLRYNVPVAITITGAFDAGRWETAIRALIDRHEALRTSFTLIDDAIVQVVHDTATFGFEPTPPAPSLDAAVAGFVRPFDLARAPLLRATVLEGASDRHTILMDLHHIIADGRSIDVLVEDLTALVDGRRPPAPPIQYKDYAAWQRDRASGPDVQAQGRYWRKLFKDGVPALALPTDFPRPPVQSFEGAHVQVEADGALVERLRTLGRETGATMTMMLLAAYAVLLSKMTDQDDVVVGIPVAGRPLDCLQRVLGMFVNTLPTRHRPMGSLTVRDYLQAVRAHSLDVYANQDYPFEDLVDALSINRDLSRTPVFDTVLAVLDDAPAPPSVEGATVTLPAFAWPVSKFDLTLLADVRGGGLTLEWEYSPRLFERATIDRLAARFLVLLEAMTRDPTRTLADVNGLPAEERRQILGDFTRTERPYPADRTIHALIEAQVARTPDRAAVVDGTETLTYAALNRRADQVARVLAGDGVGPEQVVGLIAAPSVEMVVGILAILKAGGAYLPIDPDAPSARTEAMLSDSGTRIVLLAGDVSWRDDTRRVIRLCDPALYQGPADPVRSTADGHSLAYVIYTSGTTGRPKGVMIEHHAVNNLCAWHLRTFKITPDDRMTKYARFSFDASVWEILPYLQVGAALYMIPETMRLDLPALNRFFEEAGITLAFLPTQICELFTDLDNRSLRLLFTGGDRLRRVGSGRRRAPVINNYGPTENTVITTSGPVSATDDRITIGRPIDNTRVYLLDPTDRPVPLGVTGDLCVAGAGLARGYLNDPDRTAEAFVPDPFVPGARMYRTGDLARWRPDGSLEYIGRRDAQVKVRGCRIEPREIETVLLAQDTVADAVVVARDASQGQPVLCAYVVWQQAASPDTLRAALTRALPDYMIPTAIVALERIPLNPHGKVALDRLPDPRAARTSGTEEQAPRTATEQRLAEIWRAVLGLDRVGRHDRFFDIGGDSLRATIMIAKANRAFETAVPLGAVFDHPTLATLAQRFDPDGEAPRHRPEARPIPVAPRRYYATLPAQALLYRVCAARNGVEYNLPMAFEVRGPLDIARLEGVFRALIRRHEILRTTFHLVDERVMQTVRPTPPFAIEVLPPCTDGDLGEVAHDFIRPFDVTTAPLLRVAVVPLAPKALADHRHALLIDMHHLIGDGTSMGLLFQQIGALYAGTDPAPPTITFKDFAEWRQAHQDTAAMRAHEAYWRRLLDAPPPPIRLETDFPRPETLGFAGNRLSVTAPAPLHAALRALCAREGVTLYALLLAAHKVLLHKYTGRKDIIVGVPTIGRYLAEVQDVLGMFVSTHLIRSRPDPDLRFLDYLHAVMTGVQGAVEHQEYQLWDLMVSHLLTTGQPLFGTVFVVQDQSFTVMKIEGLDLDEIDPHYNVAKFDLTMGAVEVDGRLEIELEYNTDLFRRTTARRIAEHYLTLLDRIVAAPDRPLRSLDPLPPAERHWLLTRGREPDPDRGALPDTVGTVLEAIHHQAGTAPDRVAVVWDGGALTYGAMLHRARRLAHHLRREGIGPGAIVAIRMRPHADLPCAVLAVWMVGAAYLPLALDDPPRRVAHMLADSHAHMILDEPGADTANLTVPVLIPAAILGTIMDTPTDDNEDTDDRDPVDILAPRITPTPDALACVPYATAPHADPDADPLSGVMISQAALLNRCRWFARQAALTPEDRGIMTGDLTAVSAPFDLFPMLCAGGAVWMAPDVGNRTGATLAEGLRAHGVTVAWLPPVLCEALADVEVEPLRLLITSARGTQTARRSSYGVAICTGPAETLGAALWATDGGTDTATGPTWVFGHDHTLTPVGISGTLCLGGPGLASGYLGNTTATAQCFPAHPDLTDRRMFRSGLRARWRPDDRLEITNQPHEVILDGRRVSLAEVEYRLRAYPGITDATVTVHETAPGHGTLHAAVVLRDAPLFPMAIGNSPARTAPRTEDLAFFLRAWLPPVMIPQTLAPVPRITRDAAGAADPATIPRPPRETVNATTAEPSTATLRTVTNIVEKVMGITDLGAHADLASLGLTSLQAASLHAGLSARFGTAPPATQWHQPPSIAGLSRQIADTVAGPPTAASARHSHQGKPS